MADPTICALIGTSLFLNTVPNYYQYGNSAWIRFKRWWRKDKYTWKTLSKNQTNTFYIICAYLNEYCKSDMYMTSEIEINGEYGKKIYKIPAPNTCIKYYGKHNNKKIELEILAKSLDNVNINTFEINIKKEYENILHNDLKPLYLYAGYTLETIQNILYKADLTKQELEYLKNIKIQKKIKLQIELKKKEQARLIELKNNIEVIKNNIEVLDEDLLDDEEKKYLEDIIN